MASITIWDIVTILVMYNQYNKHILNLYPICYQGAL